MRRQLEFIYDAGGWGIASVVAATVAFFVGLLEHFHGSSVSAWLLVCLSVPVFWLGSYLAWSKKREELDEERAKNKLPDLRGRIKEVFIAPAEIGAGTALGASSTDSVVLLKLEIWNVVQMDSITLKSYRLTLQSDKGIYFGVKECGIPHLRKILLFGETGYEPIQAFELETGFGRVFYLSSQPSYLGFYVEGLRSDALSEAVDLTISLEDLAGRVHTITEKGLTLKRDRIQCAP